MNSNTAIESFVGRQDIKATCTDDRYYSGFIHSVGFRSSEPFVLQEHIVTSSPLAGQKAYVAVKKQHFPFAKLRLELRQAVYRLALRGMSDKTTITAAVLDQAKERYKDWSTASIERHIQAIPTSQIQQNLDYSMKLYIGGIERRRREDSKHSRPVSIKNYSIVLVSRDMSKEAKEFLYRDRHFTFTGLKTMMEWLDTIGTCKKYLTRLTCEKSGVQLLPACYSSLSKAVRLEYFKITLPVKTRATIGEHIDIHYDDLKRYLLARRATEAESLRRLDGIHFDIGSGQKDVFDAKGVVLRTMTPELEEDCKRLIRGKLRKHFA